VRQIFSSLVGSRHVRILWIFHRVDIGRGVVRRVPGADCAEGADRESEADVFFVLVFVLVFILVFILVFLFVLFVFVDIVCKAP
jgi:hypothetical protein